MSISEWQCNELRRVADKLDGKEEVSVPFVRVLVIPIMREAADTIEALSAKLNAECELEEVDSYSNAYEPVHVLECSACGETCEHTNGAYPRCPHCGRKAVER